MRCLQVRFIEQYSQKTSGGPGAGRANGGKVHVLRVDNAGIPLETEVGDLEESVPFTLFSRQIQGLNNLSMISGHNSVQAEGMPDECCRTS